MEYGDSYSLSYRNSTTIRLKKAPITIYWMAIVILFPKTYFCNCANSYQMMLIESG